MRLSTKGRYALEALVLLGHIGESKKNISIKSICEVSNMSVRYLEQLFMELKKSEIVISKKGKYGGYQLSKQPNEISVGEILKAVEGSLAPVGCIDSVTCSRANGCITKSLWGAMYHEINNVVDNITLEMLIADYRNALKRNKII